MLDTLEKFQRLISLGKCDDALFEEISSDLYRKNLISSKVVGIRPDFDFIEEFIAYFNPILKEDNKELQLYCVTPIAKRYNPDRTIVYHYLQIRSDYIYHFSLTSRDTKNLISSIYIHHFVRDSIFRTLHTDKHLTKSDLLDKSSLRYFGI